MDRTKRETGRERGRERERERLGAARGGIKRGVARREKRARRTAVWRKRRERKAVGRDERRDETQRGNAGEKRLERKEGKQADGARDGKGEGDKEKNRGTRGRDAGWKPQAFCPVTAAATRQK